MRALVIAAVMAIGAIAHADAPPVSALITYDSTVIDAEGVTRTAHYQERMVRQGDQVWIERVMPPGVIARRGGELDLNLAARWYTRRGDGVAIGLVSAPAKTVVDLTATEAADLALPRRWLVAAEIIDLAALVPLPDRAAPGTRWYATRDTSPAVKVLWSDALRLPLVIESHSADGRASARTAIVATPLAAGAPRPWAAIGGYTHKERSDLED